MVTNITTAPASSLRLYIDPVNGFNNTNYTRSLTATLQWNPDGTNWILFPTFNNVTPVQTIYKNHLLEWSWDIDRDTNLSVKIKNTIYGTDTTGANTVVLSNTASQVVLTWHSPTILDYDPTLSPYSLLDLSLTASVGEWPPGTFNNPDLNPTRVSNSIQYDNWPVIAADIYINYESTAHGNNSFYRLTSAQNFPVKLHFVSSYLPLSTSLSDTYYSSSVILNSNFNNPITDLNSVTSFTRTTPTVSTIQVLVSAQTVLNSLTSFYTPHVFTPSTMSAIFVSAFPISRFIGYPKYVFANSQTLQTLNNSNFSTLTQGICFYGEGHTEPITLSATPFRDITEYMWDFGDYNYTVGGSLTSNNNTSTFNVSSQIGNYPSIPISLQVVGDGVLNTAPAVAYFENLSGVPSYYPFYSSTVNVTGGVSIDNSIVRQNIQVVPYDVPAQLFYPGTKNNNIYLPVDNSYLQYSAYYDLNLFSPGQPLAGCTDKYGFNWQWKAFTGCDSNPSSFSKSPSSWKTTISGAPFAKKWRNEGISNIALDAVISPVSCIGSNTTWLLSAPEAFKYVLGLNAPLTYNLQYQDSTAGTFISSVNSPYATFFFNSHITTPFCVTASETISSIINGFSVNDWQLKTTTLTAGSCVNVVGIPQLQIYTPNRYVLTGTPVTYENIFKNTTFLTGVTATFDQDALPTLIQGDANIDFTVKYRTPGPKTVTLSAAVSYGGIVTKTYTNIVEALYQYDFVDQNRYITQNTPLVPPYITQPTIAANDNAVADNINSIITKIYDNLNYLQERSRVYPNKSVETFGWLGTVYTPNTSTGSNGSTWEDFDCVLNPGKLFTWYDLSCGLTGLETFAPPAFIGAASTGLSSIPLPTYEVDITQDTNNFSLLLALLNQGWDNVTPIHVIVNVAPGVTVGSTSLDSNVYALTLNDLPKYSTLELNNYGTILGPSATSDNGPKTYSSSGTWPVHVGVDTLFVCAAVGGGGGGGSAEEVGNGGAGGGGGSGGYSAGTIPVSYGNNVSISVGGAGSASGAPGRGASASGGGGGSSTVSYGSVSVTGGGGGGGGGGWSYNCDGCEGFGGGKGSGGSGNQSNGNNGTDGAAGTNDHDSPGGGSGGGSVYGYGTGKGGDGASAHDRTMPDSWSGSAGNGGIVVIDWVANINGGNALAVNYKGATINNYGTIKGGIGTLPHYVGAPFNNTYGGGGYGPAITGINNVVKYTGNAAIGPTV